MLGLRVERGFFKRGIRLVAGVDEAGRGPWAGPVVAAAVVIGPAVKWLKGVDDSKQLTNRRRELLAAAILSRYPCALGAASTREIDRINIRCAAALAMRRAIGRLPVAADLILVDGLPLPEIGYEHESMVDGDAKSFAIACASILAKTTRDRLMRRLAPRYPSYGWEHNAGYGTPDHRRALDAGGVTPHHRLSWASVAQRDLFEV